MCLWGQMKRNGYHNQMRAGCRLTSVLPAVRSVLPAVVQSIQNEPARVNKNDLLDAIRRIVPMINDVRSKRMILTVSEEALKVKGINQEMGESLEEIDVKYSGEEHSVAYNYTYIQDVIKQIDSEIVTFMVNKDSSPTMVKEIEREDYYYIIMPMSIGEE